jgi:hypothetical protein
MFNLLSPITTFYRYATKHNERLLLIFTLSTLSVSLSCGFHLKSDSNTRSWFQTSEPKSTAGALIIII